MNSNTVDHTHLTLVAETGLQEVVKHARRASLLVLQHLTRYTHEQAIAVRGTEGGTDLLRDHLGDG